MERTRGVSPTMSSLDVDPRRSTIAKLTGMISSLNNQLEDAVKTSLKLKHELMEESDRLHDLQQKYYVLLDMYICEDCQLQATTTPDGDTICLCKACSGEQQSVKTLRKENNDLQAEVEIWKTQVETFKSITKEIGDLEEIVVK